MKTILTIALVLVISVFAMADVPSTINYQGMLTNSSGDPIDTTVDMVFSICLDSAGTLCIWGETQSSVEVVGGLFSVKMGSVVPLTADVFADDNRWLHIVIGGGGGETIEPPTELITAPYAFHVATVDGATGGNITSKVTIGINNTNTGINSFNVGELNDVSGDYAVTIGHNHDATAQYTTISGGYQSDATAEYATVGGGRVNEATGTAATIAGGWLNHATGQYSAIGGGAENYATGLYYSTVGGGNDNVVNADYASILGGFANTITSSGKYSYLFGIESNLNEDSTFMVDMPHIRFGDETDGYEFPVQDGTAGTYLITDGNGQLSWSTPVKNTKIEQLIQENKELRDMIEILEDRIIKLENK